ncbi:MAG: aldose 1-epimerase family protein [Oscillospiraceae bacterium]
MLYQLKNNMLCVQISSLGGEIVSVQQADGTEYIWQPNPAYWKKQAPHLFPIVGRLTQGTYLLDGQPYQTDTHGFFRWKEMTLVESTQDTLVLSMQNDPDTCAQYPRRWEAMLTYKLQDTGLSICFAVVNQDEKDLFFAYGGHPGFCVPLEKGLTFEDYYLQFEEGTYPVQVGFSENCFVQGSNTPLALSAQNTLPLSHSLFNNDAVVLKQTGHSVCLRSKHGQRQVCVQFAQMPYVGLWHPPGTDAPFVCIEPWTSLPSRQGVIEDLNEKQDLVCLPSGRQYQNNWQITFG